MFRPSSTRCLQTINGFHDNCNSTFKLWSIFLTKDNINYSVEISIPDIASPDLKTTVFGEIDDNSNTLRSYHRGVNILSCGFGDMSTGYLSTFSMSIVFYIIHNNERHKSIIAQNGIVSFENFERVEFE